MSAEEAKKPIKTPCPAPIRGSRSCPNGRVKQTGRDAIVADAIPIVSHSVLSGASGPTDRWLQVLFDELIQSSTCMSTGLSSTGAGINVVVTKPGGKSSGPSTATSCMYYRHGVRPEPMQSSEPDRHQAHQENQDDHASHDQSTGSVFESWPASHAACGAEASGHRRRPGRARGARFHLVGDFLSAKVFASFGAGADAAAARSPRRRFASAPQHGRALRAAHRRLAGGSIQGYHIAAGRALQFHGDIPEDAQPRTK